MRIASFLLILLSSVVLGRLSLAQSPEAEATATKKAAVDAKKLVEQLGADSFQVRERAMAELISAGPQAEAAVRAGLKHSNPEVRSRSEKILTEIEKDLEAKRRAAFLEGDVTQLTSNIKSWRRFSKMFGNTRESRAFFLSMSDGGQEVLTLGETNNSRDFGKLIAQLYAKGPSRTRRPAPGVLMAVVFVASDKQVDLDSSATFHLVKLLHYEQNDPSRLDGKNPVLKTLLGQLVRGSSKKYQYSWLAVADEFELKKDGGALARKMLGAKVNADAKLSLSDFEVLLSLGKWGDKDDIKLLAKYVNDNTMLGSSQHGSERHERRLGDVALAMCIILSGEKPKAFGLFHAPGIVRSGHKVYGFHDDDKRAAARKKWQARTNGK